MKTERPGPGTAVAEKTTEPPAEQQQESQALAPAAAAAPAVTTANEKVPIKMGLAPTSLDEAWRMANFMSKSGLVPKNYQNAPNDILVAIQYGMELGFAPMQSLQSIAVINGKPGIYGDGFMALIMSSPLYADHDEYYEVDGKQVDALTIEDLKKPNTAAVCTFWRRGKQTPVTRKFSVGQAIKAQLLGKQGPWSTYPDRMLRWRAVSWAGRDAFPDLMRGVKTAEELLDISDDDAIETVARPEPVQPRRASQAATTAGEPPTPQPVAAVPPASNPPQSEPKNDDIDEIVKGLRVTRTSFVRPREAGEEPFYLIEMISTTNRPFQFITRDEQLYKDAASFEGESHQVVIGVRDEQPKRKDARRILARIGIYENVGAAEQPSSGELFERR